MEAAIPSDSITYTNIRSGSTKNTQIKSIQPKVFTHWAQERCVLPHEEPQSLQLSVYCTVMAVLKLITTCFNTTTNTTKHFAEYIVFLPTVQRYFCEDGVNVCHDYKQEHNRIDACSLKMLAFDIYQKPRGWRIHQPRSSQMKPHFWTIVFLMALQLQTRNL